MILVCELVSWKRRIVDDEEEEQITIITIPVTQEEGGEESEDVYNSVMNIEEFLAEHNVRMEESDGSDESQQSVDIKPVLRPSIIVKPTSKLSSLPEKLPFTLSLQE